MFASAGYRLAQFGDIGLAYSDIDYRDRDRIRVASISGSARLSRAWSVTTAVSRVLTTSPSTSFSLSFVWNGDLYDTAVMGYQGSAGTGNRNDYGFARYSRRPDYNGGYGYDLEIASDRRARLRGEALTSAGQFTAEVARLGLDAGSAQRATAKGSLVAVDGVVKAGRVIDDAFILVRAPEVPGATVSRSGGRQYTLDSSGRAIIDRVQPYLESNVQVAASSLPLDANVGKLENRVRVPAKAGVVIDLAINRTKAVTFRLIFDGKPAPVGGVIEFGALKHPVGLDGLVYIQDTGKGGDASARVGGRSCRFRIPEPPEELVPDLGELTCTSQAVPAGGG